MLTSLRMVVVILVTSWMAVAVQAATTNKLSTAKKSATASKASQLEQEVLAELNLARQKPQEFAKHVEELRRQFKDDNSYTLGGVTMATREGVKAVDEAIAFLKKVKPVKALEMSPGLSLAARDHVNDLGPKGQVGHSGSDGSNSETRMKRYGDFEVSAGENITFGHEGARMIVMQLIIDDGVPGRGHRENIFRSAFKVVGLACGDHKTFRQMCVMDFAGGFRENKTARDAIKKSSR